MKTSSAKAKGRNLQKYVVERILDWFCTDLKPDDVTSRSMGCGGEDILLSPLARSMLPASIECKNRASFAVYKDYAQARSNSGEYEPILIIKQNKSRPLAVVDLEGLLYLFKVANLYEKDIKETQSNSKPTEVIQA